MDYINKGAAISQDGKYRYHLWREWRGSASKENWHWMKDENGKQEVDGAGHPLGEPKSVLFVMLNPSTADGDFDDPTIRRCVGFAKHWRYDRMDVVNLFAYRAADPMVILNLSHQDDPVGVENQGYVRRARDRAGLIVCAWGNHGSYLGQDETMFGWLEDKPTYALRISKTGMPCHPLYLPASSTLQPYKGRRA